MEYIVKFTDKSKTPVTVFENNIDTISTDIALPGRKKLEYGQDLNANFLHLLENFACPEQPNFLPTSPDFTKISDKDSQGRKLLSNPIEGQLWFNTTQETLFVFDGADWLALGMAGDIAANWGVIADGETIPQPKNKSGYIFDNGTFVNKDTKHIISKESIVNVNVVDIKYENKTFNCIAKLHQFDK